LSYVTDFNFNSMVGIERNRGGNPISNIHVFRWCIW